MKKHILHTVRPSTSVEWYVLPTEVHDHRQTNYIDTGKILSRTEESSLDDLEKTITTIFADEATFEEYVGDPVIVSMFDLRTAYHTEHGINIIDQRKVD